jgi:hypothetical protein
MIYWFLWSCVGVALCGLWGWVIGDNEEERWINAKIGATCGFVAFLFFWCIVLGIMVMRG